MSDKSNPGMNEPVAGESSLKPSIRLPSAGISNIAIIAIAVILGIILFSILEARRQAATAPSVSIPTGVQARLPAAPPPLTIPQAFPLPNRVEPAEADPPAPAPPPFFPVAQPPAPSFPPPPSPPVASPPPRTSTGSMIVVDNSVARTPNSGDPVATELPQSQTNTDRVRAAIIANRSTTVPQGTLIKAVLETALNSTNPGFARAIISRNVHSFDGTQVLIPRGSRLIGEYRTEVTPGQNRALINWTRLIRPDGVTIAIGSPATDPVGRGGVKAKVDTHFWERFSAAIFQSALDIGVNVATRQADGTVIVTQPTGSRLSTAPQIRPTLKVKPGASISVFVARDLDFSNVENGR